MKKIVLGLFFLTLILIGGGIFFIVQKNQKSPVLKQSTQEILKNSAEIMLSLKTNRIQIQTQIFSLENVLEKTFVTDTQVDYQNHLLYLENQNEHQMGTGEVFYYVFDNHTIKRYQKKIGETQFIEKDPFSTKFEIDPIIQMMKEPREATFLKDTKEYQFQISTEGALALFMTGTDLKSDENTIKVFEEATILLKIDQNQHIQSYQMTGNVVWNHVPCKMVRTVEYSAFDTSPSLKIPDDFLGSTSNQVNIDQLYAIMNFIRMDYANLLLTGSNISNPLVVTCDGSQCSYQNGTKLMLRGLIPSEGTISYDLETGLFTGFNLILSGNRYSIIESKVVLNA